MLIRKWDENKKEYEPYEVPNDWKLLLLCDDMNEIINCVNCGSKMTFGDGYTSKRYHNNYGMGYYECEKCYSDYLPIYLKTKE